MDTQSFIRNKFAEFYEKNSVNIETPKSIEKREFGFILFKERVMIRHKSFSTPEDLRAFIKQIVPSHAYYSTAYYDLPEEKMERKGWLGSDLFFDIDADHIPTKCKEIHDVWVCKNCGHAGRGVSPEACPKCGNRSFEEKTWPCEICLESAKLEAMKLVDFLTKDFGFSFDDVNCSFSGHRGYHIHVENEEILKLGSVARKEIVDYIMGIGLEPEFVGLSHGKGGITTGPKLGEAGWSGRIVKGAIEFLKEATVNDLKETNLNEETIDRIIENRNYVLEKLGKSDTWDFIRGLGKKGWEVIILKAAVNQKAMHDTVVTTDIHRLIRLPNTLHGKTGLLKASFPIKNIEEFDPLKNAVAFKNGEVTIYVEEAPQFRLGEETFGPFNRQKVELPLAAALFLLCKDAAKVID